jgi:hypothetical protein
MEIIIMEIEMQLSVKQPKAKYYKLITKSSVTNIFIMLLVIAGFNVELNLPSKWLKVV